MIGKLKTILYGSGSGVLSGNRVLRNTYWLLAISMFPTVLGALLGLNLNFSGLISRSPGFGMLAFLVVSFVFLHAIQRNRDSLVGVGILLSFTFFMGIMLSHTLGFVLGLSNGVSIVVMAFTLTSAIFTTLATAATVSKRDFSGLGKWLFSGLIVLVISSLLNLFLQVPAMVLATLSVGAFLFSGYILYDVNRIVRGGESNYIVATLSIYLNIYNLFQNILLLLGFSFGRDE